MKIGENVIRVKGKRVHLCTVRQDEKAIEKYLEWMSDEEILPYIARNHIVCTINDETEWANKQSNKTSFNIVTDDGTLIGNASLRMYCRNAVLCIVIGEKNTRGMGYGTEVVRMLVKFAFEELNAHRVELSVYADNERARKCYLKCGFTDCGIQHEVLYSHGKWINKINMEILKKDYQN